MFTLDFRRLAVALALYGAVGPTAWSADDTLLQEVIVLAQKRAENLYDVPVSVSVAGGESLQAVGARDLSTMAGFAPNVAFDSLVTTGGSTATSVHIRGVGQTDMLQTTDPGVGLFVDGVYVARSVGSLLDVAEVERVEVLRGPQGTLFGRNTIGGAINVITRPPGDELAFAARATVGSDERLDALLRLDAPLSGSLRTRVSFASFDEQGYVRRPAAGDTLGDRNRRVARAQLEFAPSEGFSASLALDRTWVDEAGPPASLVRVVQLCPAGVPNAIGGCNGNVAPGAAPSQAFLFNNVPPVNFAAGGAGIRNSVYDSRHVSANPFTNNGTGAERSTLDLWGASATLDLRLGSMSLRSITAWRAFDAFFTRDTDLSPFAIVTPLSTVDQRQFSQELQLAGGAGSRFDWLAGLYYLDELADDDSRFNTASFQSRSGGHDIGSRSFAVFGQGTLRLGDSLSLTAGARHTDEKKTYVPTQYFISSVTGQPPAGLIVIPEQKNRLSESQPTWRTALSWHPAQQWLLYGSWSTGYKSGGFVQRNQAPRPRLPTFGPETLEVFELGAKSTLADGRFRFGAALFTGDYQDIQVLVIESGGFAPITGNAGDARIRGGELEFEAALGASVRVIGGVGHLDAKYRRIAANVPGITLGSKLAESPRWSGNLGLIGTRQWRSQVWTARVDWSFRSAHFNNAENTPELWQRAYSVLNASAGWRCNGCTWSATVGVNNLTDERYLIGGNQLAVQGPIAASYARPRQWFLTVAADLR